MRSLKRENIIKIIIIILQKNYIPVINVKQSKGCYLVQSNDWYGTYKIKGNNIIGTNWKCNIRNITELEKDINLRNASKTLCLLGNSNVAFDLPTKTFSRTIIEAEVSRGNAISKKYENSYNC